MPKHRRRPTPASVTGDALAAAAHLARRAWAAAITTAGTFTYGGTR